MPNRITQSRRKKQEFPRHSPEEICLLGTENFGEGIVDENNNVSPVDPYKKKIKTQ